MSDETSELKEKTSRTSPGDTTLNRYFSEMMGHSLLEPQQEIDAAKEIERLEVNYWKVLLSYPPAFETVARSLNQLPEVTSEVSLMLASKNEGSWDELASALATRLRVLDVDRVFVEKADRYVQRLAGAFVEDLDIVGDVEVTEPLKRYLADVDAARRAQHEAKNRFVTANLRLVVAVARRYNSGGMPLPDLIQEGNFGLLKAVERFDYTRGYRFTTYATWWIRHAVSRALSNKGRAVRVPTEVLSLHFRVQRVTQKIAVRTGQPPSAAEIEQEAGISVEQLERLKGCDVTVPLSLDRNVTTRGDEDGGVRFIDLLESGGSTPHESLETKRWNNEVKELLKTLKPIEARILRWRFGLDDGEGLTLNEIGEKYNLSRERIRQIQEVALAKLRKLLAK
jgi:RNA polymerase primary sigma factor